MQHIAYALNMLYGPVSVRPSVCLSYKVYKAGKLSKRLNASPAINAARYSMDFSFLTSKIFITRNRTHCKECPVA